jgi:hypothetical protein
MHTVIVLAIGFALLAACLIAGHVFGASAGLGTGALVFLPLWLIGAGINLYLGVRTAGYTVREELPIFLLVFAIPAIAALLAWWKLR